MLISYEMQGSEEPSTTCVLLLAGELIYFIYISDKTLITTTTMGKIFLKKTFCVWVYICEVKDRVDVMLSTVKLSLSSYENPYMLRLKKKNLKSSFHSFSLNF